MIAAFALTLVGCVGAIGHRMGDSAYVGHDAAAYCSHPRRPIPTRLGEWQPVERAMGRIGMMTNGIVFRIPLPRRDLKVKAGGVEIQPSLALNGDAAFARYCDGVILMGDLVVTEPEIMPATRQLQEAGFTQTAIHKHLPQSTPSVWWMHFTAKGDPVSLARRLKSVVDVTGAPYIGKPTPPPGAHPLDLNQKAIDQAIGRKGIADGRMYEYFLPRRETIVADGHVLPPEIGVNTVIKIQGLGGGRAAINGDLLATAGEVNPVLAALVKGGIRPVEVHNHMLDESPRIFFIHYWAVGDATTLATKLRSALDVTNLKPQPAPAPASAPDPSTTTASHPRSVSPSATADDQGGNGSDSTGSSDSPGDAGGSDSGGTAGS
ncbi:DUF1259 domain-containing protein [Streptomyces sp. RB6PN25]|uniref:DUF1259 domain-containing protein n=1 Tax=Streptomyces humicola TaxID=2953240 RepID=A0ABT1Q545_9ACTN|nr:DUF1259 domain-containing protein [Streptomyces humicola]MCQ4085036.1 DUF1259 domain-containing protein [Streptomyces humicola]